MKKLGNTLHDSESLARHQVAIQLLQDKLNNYLKRPDLYFENEQEAVEHVERIEYVLQDLFGFELDRNKHRYWYQFSDCLCPKMDNEERWGTPYRIGNSTCPFHGNGGGDQ